MAQEFDRYSKQYEHTLKSSLGGEDPTYYHRHKCRIVREGYTWKGGEKVLDFGCGIGMISALLAAELPKAHITGYDISRKSITEARKRVPHVRFISSLRGAGTFDVIVVSCVLHHIPRKKHAQIIKTLRTLLSTKGKIFFFEHNPINPVTRSIVRSCPFDKNVVLLHRRYLVSLLTRNGFTTTSRYIFFFPSLLSRFRALECYMGSIPFGAQYAVIARARKSHADLH